MKTQSSSSPASQAPRLVPLSEAARRLGIAYNTAWRKAKDGTLPTVQMETGRRYVSEAVLAGLMQGESHGC